MKQRDQRDRQLRRFGRVFQYFVVAREF